MILGAAAVSGEQIARGNADVEFIKVPQVKTRVETKTEFIHKSIPESCESIVDYSTFLSSYMTKYNRLSKRMTFIIDNELTSSTLLENPNLASALNVEVQNMADRLGEIRYGLLQGTDSLQLQKQLCEEDVAKAREGEDYEPADGKKISQSTIRLMILGD